MIYKLSRLFIFCLLSVSAVSSLCADVVPVYDPDDDNYLFPLYHDNGTIAWRGLESDKKEINYDNNQIAWRGHLKKDGYYESLCSIFHRNGKVVWRGCPKVDGYYESLCSIYHDNGNTAWRGCLSKDGYYESLCSLYYNSGKTAWRGHFCENGYYESLDSIYHDNGKVAWRGWLSKEGSYYESLCSLYHNNGKLAWGGRAGDPVFDENGKMIKAHASAVNLGLGSGSWLYFHASGVWNLYLCIGDGNYLIVSNDNDNPQLLISLGSDFSLSLFPYSGDTPLFHIGDQMIEIKR
jgi:hypothetical protein